MEQTPSFLLYNASAGAGKTFTLVKNYLGILFKSSNDFKYRRVLAITFTNKAVAEMKTRIVQSLQEFSQDSILENPSPLLLAIEAETSLDRKEIQLKAKRLLKNIIQDYASFDVVTIDTFTQRIIRTFAYDLKIPQNFEVELNTQDVLEQAVDRLIDKTGSDEQITHILIDYALEKTDNDKSWDISRDFYEISKLLLRENDLYYLKLLEHKDLEDFTVLKKQIKKTLTDWEKEIVNLAQSLLGFINEQGLEDGHFSRKYLPNALHKIEAGDFSQNFNTKWIENLGSEPLYTKNQKEAVKEILDAISGELTLRFQVIKVKILHYRFYTEISKKITQLSVLQAINKEVQKIKEENNLVLISDFNQLINSQIINQPTPFIYERLGERYENYFIDEFQDTSRLQWQNLVPLIDNALSNYASEESQNSLMLVGDPKQAIYRWRGGNADQFIALAGSENPFQNKNKHLYNLPRNYRSYSEIINFNNAFFTEIATQFDNEEYQAIYNAGNAQELNHRKGGYVSLQFIEYGALSETTPLYLENVVATIRKCLDNGFRLQELSILVRKNSEGISIAQKLQEENIPVISSESLLLKHSPEVNFIVDVLHYTLEPQSNSIALKILEFLIEKSNHQQDPHSFFFKNLEYHGQELFDKLYAEMFNLNSCGVLPLYEAAEYIIRFFKLQKKGGAYIQFFLDAINEYTHKNLGGLPEFITWWDLKKERLSISTPAQSEAVQIMTIHKSKGLEFPVVIYPFADTDLYPNNSDNYNWYLPENDEFKGFEALLISQNKSLPDYNSQTAQLYHKRRSEQQLDAYNILYVALTRSVEQLHIISTTSKYPNVVNTFSDLLYGYAQKHEFFNEELQNLSLGSPVRVSKVSESQGRSKILELISTAKEEHNIAMVVQGNENRNPDRIAARNYGNLIHNLLAEIKTSDDVDSTLKKAITEGVISLQEFESLNADLRNLIQTLKSEGFFNEDHHILNERDIQLDNEIIRPDRVELTQDNKALLLDYKTGTPDYSHQQQVAFYAKNLEKMGYSVVKKALYYVDQKHDLIII